MNVLIPLYQIQDYGGITSHCEYLMKGLLEKGHSVQLVILRPRGDSYTKRKTSIDGAYNSVLGNGVQVHLTAGWYGVPVISYNSDSWWSYEKWADYIIWELPCPYKDEGIWRSMYRHKTPQIAVIHDAHYARAYKHLDDVHDQLAFIAPVNEAAWGCCHQSLYPGQMKLICNPLETQTT